jgi:acetylornithine deacetylase/succinyl-diaminopimelate desuccinylase
MNRAHWIWEAITENEVIEATMNAIKAASYSGLPSQEAEMAAFVSGILTEAAIEHTIECVEEGRYNVVARLAGHQPGKRLILNGHMDTVPLYGMCDGLSPYISEGKLYGRGAVDMKGPLMAMLYAVIGMKRKAIAFDGEIVLACVADEEERSLGSIHFLENHSETADGVVVGEPTDLRICPAHRGLQWIEIIVEGKTVHGGNQASGLNAIEVAGELICYLKAAMAEAIKGSEHPLIGRGSFNIGTITGGTQPSTVAGKCLISFDRRWVPGETLQTILTQVGEMIDAFLGSHPGYKITYRSMAENIMKGDYSHESMDTPLDAQVVQSAVQSVEAIMKTSEISFFPAWSDGALFQHFFNMPTIVFGPGDLSTAHSDEEFIEIESLLMGTEAYARLITFFFGVKEGGAEK